jgi:hypothetical protein
MKALRKLPCAKLVPVMALGAVLSAAAQFPAFSQGLDSEGAIDTIVGSDVVTGEEAVGDDQERIMAAIEQTLPNAAEVRRKFTLDKVEIVFLPDLDEQGSDVRAMLDERRDELLELQQAIEGSAMFYHAVDSRRILLRDIVGLEFENNDVTIFVAGSDPNPATAQ